MKPICYLLILLLGTFAVCCKRQAAVITFDFPPDTQQDAMPALRQLIGQLQARTDTTPLTIRLAPGQYHFYPDSAFDRQYYISNHDQENPRRVAFALEGLRHITIDGCGAELLFHGRIIPFALVGCTDVHLARLSVDYPEPALRQLNILAVDSAAGDVTATIYPPGNCRVEEQQLVIAGRGYAYKPHTSMVFRPDKRLAYRRRDVAFDPASVELLAPDTIRLKGWHQAAHTAPGERYVLRSEHRPAPGIFIDRCRDTRITQVSIHYADGMGLIAQMSENITLHRFCVAPKDTARYFSTQADATHFSACRGVIRSEEGEYTAMADDAINVHGTYLRVLRRIDNRTVQAAYMHPQTWGFAWGAPGDSVQWVAAETMETLGNKPTRIQNIQAVTTPHATGAKVFQITLADTLPPQVGSQTPYGLENLTWTPAVVFARNRVSNNRARGALFSTPRSVLCSDNIFDHTHGTAILLCGDCNGWYETGACRQVLIRRNRFVNALTAEYQFTHAVISICPEIPRIDRQRKFFHSGIVIEENLFDTFDRPLLYAKSTDGILFRNNTITYNTDFAPYHPNSYTFCFERVAGVTIEANRFGQPFRPDKDLRISRSAPDAVTLNLNTYTPDDEN